MKPRILISFILTILGIVVSLLSIGFILFQGYSGEYWHNSLFLILGLILMVFGVLLKQRVELAENESILEDEQKEISELFSKEKEGISRWRFRDLEYRMQKLDDEIKKLEDKFSQK